MYTAKTSVKNKKRWTCPKCGRKFERHGQSHSCKSYPIELHFENKPNGKVLYKKLVQAMRNELGKFKIESLECCIHFVAPFSFAAVKIRKDKIRVDFVLSRKIENERINQSIKMSANRYLYVIDITNEKDIDNQLMAWLHEVHELKSKLT